MVVDLFLVYQFIRRLATPFEKWEAYKLSIIDKDGNVLMKSKEFTNSRQRKAWGIFDRMVANLKKLLAKVPGGSSRFATYAAALYLIKEHKAFTDESMLEDMTEEQMNESTELFLSRYNHSIMMAENVNKKDLEEEPANNVGGGNIAGMDGGHMSKAGQKKWTSSNKTTKKKRLRDIIGDKL